MSLPRVLTITLNPSIDIGTEADEVVTDEKTRCAAPVFDPGGGGINVARVLTRLGVHSDALFVCGGYTGNLLKQMMAEEEIRSIPIESLDVTRQNIAIIDNSIGKQFRFVLPGVISKKSTWKQVLKKIEDSIDQYDFVVASGSLPEGVPEDIYSTIGAIARKAGKSYVIDTSGRALTEGIKNGATYIKPNQEEFEDMKVMYGANSDEMLCSMLFDQGVEHIIHTLGKKGTRLITSEGVVDFAPPSIKVRSTTGAGDSFIGGLIGGLVKGYTRDKAVAYGISAAASTLQSEGTDLCDPDEVTQIFETHFGGA